MKVLDLKKKSEKDEPQAILFKWAYKRKEGIDRNWQIGVSLFFVFCLVFFFWQKNYFGVGLILIIAFLIFFLPRQAKEQSFAILKRGVRIENEIFPWENLESFWIFEEPPELYLKNKKNFPSYITLSLNERDVDRVKKILLNYLPEKETERSTFDIIGKKIGI
jgi:hypothetical protein